jgi:glutamyl-tRNA reductase
LIWRPFPLASTVHLAAVGLSYLSAPLEVRERVMVGTHELEAALAQLKAAVQEGLIISTCNRTEVYALLETDTQAERLLGILADRAGVPAAALCPHGYVLQDADAIRHMFRVASGLESMVLGEDQIQAQVKRAIIAARSLRVLGPMLGRLGDMALACGKRVRASTGVGRHAVSLESLAVRTGLARLGTYNGRHVVVIGAGESATLVARHLRQAGARRDLLTIVSRSRDRSAAVAVAADAHSGSLADLSELLTTADIVFACTSAPHPVLTPDFLAQRSLVRPAAPLLCVDMGMPRDVHTDVNRVPDVCVLTLNELAAMADEHRAARRADIPAAEQIVEAEVTRFLGWMRARGAADRVAALSGHARAVADAELARALARLPNLDDRGRAVVAELAHRIARKLAHEPIQQLKQAPNPETVALG